MRHLRIMAAASVTALLLAACTSRLLDSSLVSEGGTYRIEPSAFVATDFPCRQELLDLSNATGLITVNTRLMQGLLTKVNDAGFKMQAQPPKVADALQKLSDYDAKLAKSFASNTATKTVISQSDVESLRGTVTWNSGTQFNGADPASLLALAEACIAATP